MRLMIGDFWTGSATGFASPAFPTLSNAKTTNKTNIIKANVENLIESLRVLAGRPGTNGATCNPAARRDRSPLPQILNLLAVKRND